MSKNKNPRDSPNQNLQTPRKKNNHKNKHTEIITSQNPHFQG